MPDLVIRSRNVVTPQGVSPAAVLVRDGLIAAVTAYDDVPAGAELYDAGGLVVMPGLVDTHVHINEPGRGHWEGFRTATQAAAAGGITTLIEMPLNSIPATTTLAAFRDKLQAAEDKLSVDVGFWGGVVPGNAGELRAMWGAGVFGFKCFLVPSGVDEFPAVDEAELRAALVELGRLGAPLLVHAELPGPIEQALHARGDAPLNRYATWLAARPRAAENDAIDLLLRLAREMGARIHIVHLSSSDAIPRILRAREAGLPVSVETCPHYLFFSAERIPDGATEFKCAPPIREIENNEKLWDALVMGLIDLVVSDHSPCPPEMKCKDAGDFLRAWGGIASLQLSLPVMWTAMRRRGDPVERLAQWMCEGPAALAGLGKRRGTIAPGYSADLVVWDPEGSFRVDPTLLHHRHKLTPYAGRQLHGVVKATFLRGKKIYEDGKFPCPPSGAVLKRGAA